MQVKGHAAFGGAGSSSVLLESADPIGSGGEKKKETSNTFPIPSLPNLIAQEAALGFPRVAKCSRQR